MRKRNVAVIGLGYWGPNLLRNLAALPDANVKTICDVSEDRLAYFKRQYPAVETTTDHHSIAEDSEIDAVAIATPVSSHHSLGMEFLAAGKHTFLEKPLAASVAECQEMIDLAARKDLVLMVGHTFLYSASIRKIKSIIEHGDIGETMYINARRLNLGLFQKDINVAWDLAPHDLSVILHLLHEEPVAVNCQGKAHIASGIEDVTNMSLTFPNGSFAVIQSSWIDPKKVREITIVGSRRMIVYDDTESIEKIKIYDKHVEAPPHYDTFAEFTYSYHYGDIYGPYVQHVEPLKVECQHFLDCISQNIPCLSGGIDGMKVVQILEAATESLRGEGRMVDLKPASQLVTR